MPLFSLFSSLKMTNSRAVMVLLYTAVSVPYTIYFLLAFHGHFAHLRGGRRH